MKEYIYTDCNHTLDMNASHYKINRASPLPPGEGQGEGVYIQAVSLILSPHPNPLPEGEGVCGTAVLWILLQARIGFNSSCPQLVTVDCKKMLTV